MTTMVEEKRLNLVHLVLAWQEKHPYLFANIIAVMITAYIMFSMLAVEVTEEDLTPSDNIEFIDIDQIRTEAPRRVVRREYSTTTGAVDPTHADVDRAQGTSDDANAVDLTFHPNVVPPRPIGRLKKKYPKIARENGIEALLNVEMLIASNGRVKSVRILAIRLSKTLPAEMHTDVAKSFARDAVEILKDVRFSPPVVQGKQVPVKFEMPLRFRLDD